jgi:hypothetical protein
VFDPASVRAWKPSVDLATITTFSGFDFPTGGNDPEKAKPYVQNKVNCMAEAYMNENPNATPAAMYARARGCGWPGAAITVGVYGGYRLVNYKQALVGYPFWSVYLAETLIDEDWEVAAEINSQRKF